jgi:hypothetical protein
MSFTKAAAAELIGFDPGPLPHCGRPTKSMCRCNIYRFSAADIAKRL